MRLLQNLKDFFDSIFPLHLHSTVLALEEDLADAELELYFSKVREGVLRMERDGLRDVNREVCKDNRYLNANLEQARQHIRVVQQELDEVYSSMTPKLSSWPMPVRAHLEDTNFGHYVIRVELPPLRLSCMVNEAVRRGMYQGYLDAFADEIARAAHREVKAATIDILKNVLPIK